VVCELWTELKLEEVAGAFEFTSMKSSEPVSGMSFDRELLVNLKIVSSVGEGVELLGHE